MIVSTNKNRMKNLIRLGMIAAVLATFIFTSCSKDEEEFSLVGKTYAAFSYHSNAYNGTIIQTDGYDAYDVYRFISDTECEVSTRKNSPTGGIIGDIDIDTYTLDYPTIKIKCNEEYTATGTFINQETFRITWKNGKILEYIKQ